MFFGCANSQIQVNHLLFSAMNFLLPLHLSLSQLAWSLKDASLENLKFDLIFEAKFRKVASSP